MVMQCDKCVDRWFVKCNTSHEKLCNLLNFIIYFGLSIFCRSALLLDDFCHYCGLTIPEPWEYFRKYFVPCGFFHVDFIIRFSMSIFPTSLSKITWFCRVLGSVFGKFPENRASETRPLSNLKISVVSGETRPPGETRPIWDIFLFAGETRPVEFPRPRL